MARNPRLPSVKSLSRTIQTQRISKLHTVADSQAWLLSHRSLLIPFADIEDLVFHEELHPSSQLRGCMHHMSVLRRYIARELWSRGFYLGRSVVEALVYRATLDASATNPIQRVLEYVRGNGLHHPGLVLYPLHSFGIAGAGGFQVLAKGTTRFIEKNQGLLITPQTNSIERTVDFLADAASQLEVKRRIPLDLVMHWSKSRPTAWLTRNPLLALRVSSFPGTYYENQFFLVVRLRAARAAVLMLAVLQRDTDSKDKPWTASSASVNNFETLDIKHYLTFYPSVVKKQMLDGDCVPMNARKATLAELSFLGVNLHTKLWTRRTRQPKEIADCLETVSSAFITSHFADKNSPYSRVVRKIWTSVGYFMRSFRQADRAEESIVSLAIAFEVLLTDNYSAGVEGNIQNRLRLALKGIPGTRKRQEAVRGLYKARSEVVHEGSTSVSIDIDDARLTFVIAFISICKRIGNVPSNSSAPIGAILEDVSP